MPSGIYEIFNKVSGKRYVGSASDIAKRWHAHRKKLHLGTHHSPKLQNSWDKHGADKFEFITLELVHDKSKLTEREQFWIDHFNAVDNGYNIDPVAGSSRGVARGPQPDEVRRKISEAQKGRRMSDEHYKARFGIERDPNKVKIIRVPRQKKIEVPEPGPLEYQRPNYKIRRASKPTFEKPDPINDKWNRFLEKELDSD